MEINELNVSVTRSKIFPGISIILGVSSPHVIDNEICSCCDESLV